MKDVIYEIACSWQGPDAPGEVLVNEVYIMQEKVSIVLTRVETTIKGGLEL